MSGIGSWELKWSWDQMVLVGRVARPHGLRGQVVVTPETDFVEERFRAGATFWTRSDRGDEALTVSSARVQNGRPVIGFEGFATIEDVERLAGLELRVPEDSLQPLAEGAYYVHDLVGCVVETTSGEQVGEVRRVDGGAGASVLSVRGPRGRCWFLLPPIFVSRLISRDDEFESIHQTGCWS